ALSCACLLFFTPRPPASPRFPYTTLFRSQQAVDQVQLVAGLAEPVLRPAAGHVVAVLQIDLEQPFEAESARLAVHERDVVDVERDRKSTRLNSSHVKISYAVFCLKKKREQ